jgi:hypothetical protein
MLFPIKAKTATFPDFIIEQPLLYLDHKNNNSMEKLFLKASNKGEINKTPCFAGLNTTVFP